MQLTVNHLNNLAAATSKYGDDYSIVAHCLDEITHNIVLIVSFQGYIAPVEFESWKRGYFPLYPSMDRAVWDTERLTKVDKDTFHASGLVALNNVWYVMYSDLADPDSEFYWLQTLAKWNSQF